MRGLEHIPRLPIREMVKHSNSNNNVSAAVKLIAYDAHMSLNERTSPAKNFLGIGDIALIQIETRVVDSAEVRKHGAGAAADVDDTRAACGLDIIISDNAAGVFRRCKRL